METKQYMNMRAMEALVKEQDEKILLLEDLVKKYEEQLDVRTEIRDEPFCMSGEFNTYKIVEKIIPQQRLAYRRRKCR